MSATKSDGRCAGHRPVASMGHFRGDKIVDPEHSVHIQDEDDWEIHKSPALFSKGTGVGFPLYMAVWGKPDPTVCARLCLCEGDDECLCSG